MRTKPVVLIYDLDNRLVEDLASLVGADGEYTTINTFNEINAMGAVRQYNRGFGCLTNKLSCIITGWNHHKRPRDQFLYRLRAQERRSPLRRPTPVIIVSEDHRHDLKQRALDPAEGGVAAYLSLEGFRDTLLDILEDVVIHGRAGALNARARAEFETGRA